MTKKRLKRKRQLATRKTALQGGSLRGLTDLAGNGAWVSAGGKNLWKE